MPACLTLFFQFLFSFISPLLDAIVFAFQENNFKNKNKNFKKQSIFCDTTLNQPYQVKLVELGFSFGKEHCCVWCGGMDDISSMGPSIYLYLIIAVFY